MPPNDSDCCPQASVPDDATRELMVAFHERLQAGLPPAHALAAVQAASAGDAAVSASFVCFGVG